MDLNLAILGAGGRMGAAIAALAAEDKTIKLTALVDAKGSAAIGAVRQGLTVTADAAAAFEAAEVAIDFTTPAASLAHAALAAKSGKALIIGTTGFDEAGKAMLAKAAERAPIVFSPNMSLAANILFDVAERVASLLPGFDVEITEAHHNQKKDAPSGTARRLAEGVQRGRKAGRLVFGREGQTGARARDEIGVHALRGGDAVGDHTVFYFGPGERLELTHRATSRAAFAAGAIAAARWAARKPAGLYDMRNVLGLVRK